MPVTKFESYYSKLETIFEAIRQKEDYNNLSLAFAHWFLQNHEGLNEQQIGESIIDGTDDKGIDAAIVDRDAKSLTLYQFKFPLKQNIGREIDEGSILKTFNGVKTVLSQNSVYTAVNPALGQLRDSLKDTEIYSVKVIFVSYNKGIVAKANKETVETNVNSYKDDFDMSYSSINRNDILNIYEKLQRTNSISVKLKMNNMQTTYQTDTIESYVGVISGKELALSVNGKLAVIFDENIRLFEPDSRVNSGILTTATSNTEADMFYFYNNGVTFIGDSVKYSPTNQMVSIEGASIVNGCQTVTTLCKAYEQGRLNDDVFILVRFIMSGDYDKRSRITEALNSQTPIKDSYFIANHPIVRELQKELLKKHYYLERQVNEFAYKKSYGNEIPDKTFEILHLDDSVQYFTGYYMDKYAPAAKSGKGSLFNKDIIEDILSQISADKVITARETYVHVAAIITKFRRNRRNEKNTEFAKVMRFDNDQFDSNDYLFLNTADIILLNAVGHLKNHVLNAANCTETFDDESLVRVAILHLKKMIHSNPQYKRMLPANITRNKQVYVELRDDLSKTISKDLS